MTTALALEAELAGEERAIRHLIGEQKALGSQIARQRALEQLAATQLKAITTRSHPALRQGGPLPHGARFPDVSSFQPNVNWPAVRHAASLKVGLLAVAKISEGGGWTDPFGAARFREMAANGFAHRGGYHFYHPAVDPAEQARHFLAALHTDGVEVRESDILICDLEVSDGESSSVVRAGASEFGEHVRQESPAKLWLYSGGPFIREYGVTLRAYDAHWLPAYTSDPRPYMVFGARTIAWQYTDGVHGPVPHVCPGVGACDMSILL